MPETNLAESMDESLNEALNEIKSRTEEADNDADDKVVVDADEADDKIEGEDDADAKAEDEPDSKEADKGDEDEAEDKAGSDDDGEEAGQELEDHLKRPPSTWRAQAKADYNKLPAHIKAEVHKREQDTLNGLNQYKEQAQFGERLNKAIQPYQAFLNSQRIQPEKAVQDALNLGYSLHTANPQQKSQILMQIAKQYGADMGVFAQPQDPKQEEVGKYISPLEQKITRLEQMLTGQQQHSQQQQLQEATTLIDSFVNAVNEDGSQKHPYFDNVQDMMTSLLESGRATTLEDAYEKAIWADPDTRQVLVSEQTKRDAAKRQEEAKKRAAKAEKANKANLDKKGKFDSQANPTGTIDDTLKQELDRIRARDS